MTKNYESGRSMVEMLGTLAIIGVLSVGAIVGYSYAMDKYRANETINDINMRGIDLVRQVAMGQTLSLSEWPTTSKAGYIISDPVLIEGDAYFSISNVPQSVCEMVYEGIQNNQTTKVEVNRTLAEDASACNKEEDNTMGFFFITNAGEGGTTPEDLCKNKTCPEGYSCTHGICLIQDKPEYLNGSGRIMCEKELDCGLDECVQCRSGCQPVEDGTSCENGTKVCHGGACVDKVKTCSSNTDCFSGEFCGDTNEDSCEAHPYKCKKLNYREVELPNGTLFISNLTMSYWDAENACAKLGARLLTNEEAIKLRMFESLWFWVETKGGECVADFYKVYSDYNDKENWYKNSTSPYGDNISMVCIQGEANFSPEDSSSELYSTIFVTN